MHVIISFYSMDDVNFLLLICCLCMLFASFIYWTFFFFEKGTRKKVWNKACMHDLILENSTHFHIRDQGTSVHQWKTYLSMLFPSTKEVIVNAPKWKSTLRYLSIWKQGLVLKRLVTQHLYEDGLPSICPCWLLCIHNSCGSAAISNHASFLLKHLKRQNYSSWNTFCFVKNRC